MKLIKILAIIFLLTSTKNLQANDSLTLAQAYINLSLTDEYFDTLSVTRIDKIIPFIEQELGTIKDTGFISKNSTLYHFTYSLLYTNMARLLYRTRQDFSRQKLLEWKNTLDMAIGHFNQAKTFSYFNYEKEKDPFYEFVKFDVQSSYNLENRIRRLKFHFAYHFNQDIYPDFKRIFYAAKSSKKYYLDSLSYYASIYNMPLWMMDFVQNKKENYLDYKKPSYQLAIGLDIISKFLQFDKLANEEKVITLSDFDLENLYESWENFIKKLNPNDTREFYTHDRILNKDFFFRSQINANTSANLYEKLQEKYPFNGMISRDPPTDAIMSFNDSRRSKYYFPIPVPFPSAFHYKSNFQPGLKSMKQVDNYLSTVFNRAGYKGNLHYYYVPSPGFALTTSLEKINKNGSPVSGSTRWSASIGDNNSFSFYDVFKSIFFDTKSDYRMFALIVSVRGAGIQRSLTSIGTMQELIKYSYPSLPQDLENEVLPYKTLSAFTYLFRQSDVGEVPMLDVSRRLSMETHLQRSGLGELLK